MSNPNDGSIVDNAVPPGDDAMPKAPPRAQSRDLIATLKREDVLRVMPLLGLALLVSPLLNAVATIGDVWGVPAVVAFIFVAWATLIWWSRRIARRHLAARDDPPPDVPLDLPPPGH